MSHDCMQHLHIENPREFMTKTISDPWILSYLVRISSPIAREFPQYIHTLNEICIFMLVVYSRQLYFQSIRNQVWKFLLANSSYNNNYVRKPNFYYPFY